MEIKFKIWADNKFYNKCLIGNTSNKEDKSWTCPLVWLKDRKEWVHCDNGIICQSVGIKDRYRNDVFDGDYILYDTGKFRSFIKVSRGKVEFTFRRWDIHDKKWKRCTHQGIDVYGQAIGNIYEGIKSKRILNEMLEQGIEI